MPIAHQADARIYGERLPMSDMHYMIDTPGPFASIAELQDFLRNMANAPDRSHWQIREAVREAEGHLLRQMVDPFPVPVWMPLEQMTPMELLSFQRFPPCPIEQAVARAAIMRQLPQPIR